MIIHFKKNRWVRQLLISCIFYKYVNNDINQIKESTIIDFSVYSIEIIRKNWLEMALGIGSDMDKYFNSFYDEQACFLDYIQNDYLLLLDDIDKINTRQDNIVKDNFQLAEHINF